MSGGLSSTTLAIFPFMQQWLEKIFTAAANAWAKSNGRSAAAAAAPLKGGAPAASSSNSSESSESSKDNLLLSVYVGHDTQTAAMLTSLGVFSSSYCEWPGYAARIVLEVWQPRSLTSSSSSSSSSSSFSSSANLRGSVYSEQESIVFAFPGFSKLFPHLLSVPATTNSSSSSSSQSAGTGTGTGTFVPKQELYLRALPHTFVRVLYQGVDVTQRIPSCSAEREKLACERAAPFNAALAGIVDSGLTLCSMEAVFAQVTSWIAPHASIEDACKWNE
jgi:hypothetical protein